MKVFAVLALVCATAVAGAAAIAPQAGDRRVEILVYDSQNLPVPGAQVTVAQRQGVFSQTATGTSGAFQLSGLAPAIYDVRIEAEGLEVQTLTADLRTLSVAALEVRLRPARFAQDVIVAASRTEQRIADVPASARVLSVEEIRQSPAVAADDVLRQIPTFSLFRRTSSLAAHPTAQGVSLRGIGPSGVSRTLVLLDDIPFNDPFGGWVYWTRVPMMNVNRIEMVDSANSAAYGNYAMGGVINVVTPRPAPRTLILSPQYGGRNNADASGSSAWDGAGIFDLYASDVWGDLGVAFESRVFRTNGYPIVTADARGPIDTKAWVDYENFNLKLDYAPSDRFSTFFRGGYFSEDRSNAKICLNAPAPCEETNDTIWRYGSAGVRARLSDESDFQARVFANFETFRSNFLAVPDAGTTRATARISLLQEVPSQDVGFLTQWSKALGARQYFTVGVDWRRVEGDSEEDVMNQTTGARTLERISGGTQRSVGVFVQNMISVTPQLQLTLGARLDHWKNYDAHNLETVEATGQPGAGHNPDLPDKSNTVGSPRAGLLYRITPFVSVWGNIGWGFRAPTLNELYRQFRVGTALTLANENLGPERLVGGEIGVNMAPAQNVTWRTTWFHNRLTNPVSNVTLSVTPAQTTRQRQNLGKARIWGLQSDVEYRPGRFWRFSAGYLYNVAKVREFADETLVGKFLPQVPLHRGSVQAAYLNPTIVNVSAQAQFVGGQYDNDQNTLWLPYFGTLDVNFNRPLSNNLEVFFGVQNLLDREFVVQRNPTTIGAPRSYTGGLRLSLSGN